MNEQHKHTKQAPSSHERAYEYVTAGVRERSGKVPLWLIAVIVGLFAWGGYYLIAFWNP